MPGFVSCALAVIAMIGIVYTLAGAALAGRWANPVLRRRPEPRAAGATFETPVLLPAQEHGDALKIWPSITMLKPLHGTEPDLHAKLMAFLDQEYPGTIDMVCGISDQNDPALDTVRNMDIAVVWSSAQHGSNAKISNLINMEPAATGDILILSDSDMIVPRDYAIRIVSALSEPGVGAVTLLYAGRGETGGWSRLAAAGISWGFLPSVMTGLATGLAKPCMGSTIAMRRETLDAIGGFRPFADLLADDHAIGMAVRALGLKVVVPPMIVIHGCTETSLAAVIAHELRWNATVRMLDPAGYAGSIVTYPVAFALLAGIAGAGWWALIAALIARLALAARIDHITGERTAPLWWLPARDLLSFGLYLGAFFTRRVDWRGARLHMTHDGRVTAGTETRRP